MSVIFWNNRLYHFSKSEVDDDVTVILSLSHVICGNKRDVAHTLLVLFKFDILAVCQLPEAPPQHINCEWLWDAARTYGKILWQTWQKELLSDNVESAWPRRWHQNKTRRKQINEWIIFHKTRRVFLCSYAYIKDILKLNTDTTKAAMKKETQNLYRNVCLNIVVISIFANESTGQFVERCWTNLEPVVVLWKCWFQNLNVLFEIG